MFGKVSHYWLLNWFTRGAWTLDHIKVLKMMSLPALMGDTVIRIGINLFRIGAGKSLTKLSKVLMHQNHRLYSKNNWFEKRQPFKSQSIYTKNVSRSFPLLNNVFFLWINWCSNSIHILPSGMVGRMIPL